MLKFLTLCISGVMLGCIYGLIYKASGLMSFVQGDMLTLGAFLGLTFYSILGLPYWLSLLLTMLCAFAFGMLLEKGVIRRLLNKKVMPIYVVLATIAISYILQNGSQLIWGTWTLNFPSVFKVSTVKLFGLLAVQPEVILCLIQSMVSMVVLHLFMNKTKLGTAMRASSMDSMAAESCGINVSLTTGITWGEARRLSRRRRYDFAAFPVSRRFRRSDPRRQSRQQGLCWRDRRRLWKYVWCHRRRYPAGPARDPGQRLCVLGL